MAEDEEGTTCVSAVVLSRGDRRQGQRTTWEHDVLGRVTREIRADNTTDTFYTYDLAGRLRTVTDPKDQVTTYTYTEHLLIPFARSPVRPSACSPTSRLCATTRCMAKKSKKAKASKKTTKRPAAKPAKKKAAPKRSASRKVTTSRADALLGPIKGATSREIGTVKLDVVEAGAARVKRMIYPPGFRWSKAMQPVVGTERCMHAHVGFIARGEIHIEYADGCVVEYKAPQVVAIDPGHDGWVVGREPVVMIEFDFGGDTVAKLGMPTEHSH